MIDLFRYLIEATKDIFQVQEDDKTYIPLRIISDHLRASCFLISDGVIPRMKEEDMLEEL